MVELEHEQFEIIASNVLEKDVPLGIAKYWLSERTSVAEQFFEQFERLAELNKKYENTAFVENSMVNSRENSIEKNFLQALQSIENVSTFSSGVGSVRSETPIDKIESQPKKRKIVASPDRQSEISTILKIPNISKIKNPPLLTTYRVVLLNCHIMGQNRLFKVVLGYKGNFW